MDQIFSLVERDPKAGKSLLEKIDDAYYAKEDLNVVIPTLYFEKELAKMGSNVETLGLFAITGKNGKYGVLPRPNSITLFSRMVVTRGEYNHVIFKKGQKVMMARNSISGDLVEPLFKEMIKRGKIPSFVTYEIYRIFLTNIAKKTNVKFLSHWREVDLILSVAGRLEDNPRDYYRYAPEGQKVHFIDLEDKKYMRANWAIFTASHFREGRKELIIRSEKYLEASNLEKIIRNKS